VQPPCSQGPLSPAETFSIRGTNYNFVLGNAATNYSAAGSHRRRTVNDRYQQLHIVYHGDLTISGERFIISRPAPSLAVYVGTNQCRRDTKITISAVANGTGNPPTSSIKWAASVKTVTLSAAPLHRDDLWPGVAMTLSAAPTPVGAVVQ